MYKFIKRNLLIFTKDKLNIFFSFLGMLIGLTIYIFFLRTTLINSLHFLKNADQFMDTWMIPGLISIVSITSALGILGLKIEDKANNNIYDFKINSNLNNLKITLSYLITSIIEGVVSTFIFSLIGIAYLAIQYRYNPFNIHYLIICLLNLLLIIFSSELFLFIINFLKTTTSFSSLSAIVGTISGFLSGTYIIYGELPNFMQHIIKFWPGFQVAACSRYELLKAKNFNMNASMLQSLGINSNLKNTSILLIVLIIIFFLFNIALSISKSNKN